ncbi:hypothetical protein CFB89_10515 [Burkholderia sp. AU16741]|nr:hypothetical protein CFB89_10515 [Burkholderia sp. AU16741]
MGRIIRRASAMKNLCIRQIIIAKSAVSHIVAGQFHAAGSGPGTRHAGLWIDARATMRAARCGGLAWRGAAR